MYIDKTDSRLHSTESADRLFLQDCFDEETREFHPRIGSEELYKSFSGRKYRKGLAGWEHLLASQQGGRCCYCMRRLGKSNIEHIIPRNMDAATEREQFTRYTSCVPLLADSVELTKDFALRQFSSKKEIAHTPKMPHTIALTNLLVSCNGKFDEVSDGCCCNGRRGNEYLTPLMLMPEAQNRVRYDSKSGAMYVYPEEPSWKKTVDLLNEDTYKEVRRLWRCIAKSHADTSGIGGFGIKRRILFIKDILATDNFEDTPEEYRKYAWSDSYWRLLADFDWFGSYEWGQ